MHLHLFLHQRSVLSAGARGQEQDCLLYTDLCFPPVTCCVLQNIHERILPPSLTCQRVFSSLCGEQVDTDDQPNRREIDCAKGGGMLGGVSSCARADDFCAALEVAH